MESNRITEVECLFPDFTGNARGKIIPANKFLRGGMRLPEVIFTQTVTGEYPDDDSMIDPLGGTCSSIPIQTPFVSYPGRWSRPPR